MYKILIDKEAVKLRCSTSGRNMYDLLSSTDLIQWAMGKHYRVLNGRIKG